jgi:dTDP-4-dehydrorhamnose reductase
MSKKVKAQMALRLLITGANGSLGQDFQTFVHTTIPDAFELMPLSKADFDLSRSADALFEHLNEIKPDIILNAGAFTQVDAAEAQKKLALAANATGPGFMAEWTTQKPERYLIHVSTDYVFNGQKEVGQLYEPSEPTDPVNYYGYSKLKGEELVLQAAPSQALVLRTSWLFGSQARGFVSFVQKNLQAGKPSKIASDQVGTPTWTGSLCEMIRQSINDRPSGVLHGCNAGYTTRWDQALWIAECLNLSDSIEFEPVTTRDLNLPAQRPMNTAMKSSFDDSLDWKLATESYFHTLLKAPSFLRRQES